MEERFSDHDKQRPIFNAFFLRSRVLFVQRVYVLVVSDRYVRNARLSRTDAPFNSYEGHIARVRGERERRISPRRSLYVVGPFTVLLSAASIVATNTTTTYTAVMNKASSLVYHQLHSLRKYFSPLLIYIPFVRCEKSSRRATPLSKRAVSIFDRWPLSLSFSVWVRVYSGLACASERTDVAIDCDI